MNQTQTKYARQRADAIYASKKMALKGKYTTPGVVLDRKEKVEALRKGEFTVKDELPRYGDSITGYIKFNAESEPEFDEEGYNAEKVVLEATFTKLMDELILGDAEEALQLIKTFEANA